MTGNLAGAIAGQGDSGASLRTGTVVGITGTALTVDIGGGETTDMPYLDGYLPVLGDRVAVLQQGAVCLVIGSPAGMPDTNMVANPSFELDLAGAFPAGWSAYANPDPAYPGTASIIVEVGTGWGAKDGRQWLRIKHEASGNANIVMSSDPIAVSPGERWAAVAWTIFSAQGGLGIDTPAMAVSLGFLADPTGAYPTDVLAEAEQQWINGPTGGTWVAVRAITGTGALVPEGCTAMRVLLDTTLSSGVVYWDKVVARKLS